jgi:putative addiction module component (TIGR02574 family)
VTNAAQKVFTDALSLPEYERRLLAEALLNSLSEESRAELDDAWRDEVLRRVKEVQSGQVKLESWEEVRQAGREALSRR